MKSKNRPSGHRGMYLVLAAAVCAAITAQTLAVMPVTWNQSGESFARGQHEATVLNAEGEIVLGRQISVLMKPDAAPPVVSAIAAGDKAIFVGNGAKNVIHKIEDGKVSEFCQPGGTMITCLLWSGKDLLAGTGGDKGGIYRIDAQGKAALLWSDAKVKYIWAMVAGPKGSIYVATGPEGGVYQVEADGKAQSIYQAPAKLAKNIMCLAAAKDGMLYAGTDTNGLVIQIDTLAGAGRVVLDAQEKEITAIVAADDGEVFVATADAARSGGASIGRPPGGMPGFPMPMPTQPTIVESASKPTVTSTGSSTGPSTAAKSSGAVSDEDEDEGDCEDGEESDAPAVTALTPSTEPDAASASKASAEAEVPAPEEDEEESPAGGPGGPGGPGMPGRPGAGGPPQAGGGSSIYRLHKDGLVSTVFERPLSVLAMIQHNGRLVVASGSDGSIYSVSTTEPQADQIAKTEAKQVTCLAATPAGSLIFGTSNKGSVGSIETALSKEGTYTSKALDAQQISKWGTMRLVGKVPNGAAVTIATRTGNVAEPDDKSWGKWSKEQAIADGYLQIDSPTGRYIQYRVKLAGDGKATAAVGRLSIVHQVGNLAPAIASVTVTAGAAGGPGAGGPPRGMPRMNMPAGGDDAGKAMRQIAVQAADANSDQMIYALYFREVGAENWIKIIDKHAEPSFAWDTRTVGDGQYEVKAVACDSPSNPPGGSLECTKLSKRVVVDNTAPAVKELLAKVDGQRVTVKGTAADASRLSSIQYSLSSQTEWVTLLPSDGICDCNQEAFSFDVKDLKPGSHRIAIKVQDMYGNTGYGTATVTIAK